jgi:hypothetical protein
MGKGSIYHWSFDIYQLPFLRPFGTTTQTNDEFGPSKGSKKWKLINVK